jgi:hypothetical protein
MFISSKICIMYARPLEIVIKFYTNVEQHNVTKYER